MSKTLQIVFILISFCFTQSCNLESKMNPVDENFKDKSLADEQVTDHKLIIYEISAGFADTNNTHMLTDFNESRIAEIKHMGISHILLRGVEIPVTYDTVHFIAKNSEEKKRMNEFVTFSTLCHAQGLKLILDFKPKRDSAVKITDTSDVAGIIKNMMLQLAENGVDGFHFEPMHGKPVEFWDHMFSELKKIRPYLVFIGSVVNKEKYPDYLEKAKFDFILDDAGMFSTLREIIINDSSLSLLDQYRLSQTGDISGHLVNFTSRSYLPAFVSQDLASNMQRVVPAITVLSAIHSGPVLLRAGQEYGKEYTGIKPPDPLSKLQKSSLTFYTSLLNVCQTSDAIKNGKFFSLQESNKDNTNYNENYIYSFLRYTNNQRLMIVANFSDTGTFTTQLTIPANTLKAIGLVENSSYIINDLLNSGTQKIFFASAGVNMELKPNSAYIFEIK